jgi:putative ABC transport system substrate-binding protein
MGTQQQTKFPRVGVIANGSPDTLFEALRQSFPQHGYIEGSNIVIEARFAHGHLDRVPELVAELVGLNVDVIVSLGAVGPAAAQKANTKVSIVFVAVIDPVAVGFAATLERPGGNITGITTFDPEQATKQLELLRQVIPSLVRLAILSDEDVPRVATGTPWRKRTIRRHEHWAFGLNG